MFKQQNVSYALEGNMKKLVLLTLFGLLTAPIHNKSYAGSINPALKNQLMLALSNNLKDPMSAQLKNLRLEKDDTICGELNAKNSYGGFTGYKPFMYRPNAENVVILNVEGLPKSINTAEDTRLWTDAWLHASWLESYGCLKKGLSEALLTQQKKLIGDQGKRNRR